MKHEMQQSTRGRIHEHQWHVYGSGWSTHPFIVWEDKKKGLTLQRRLAYLASGVNDVAVVLNALVVDTLGKNILNSWIVGFDKMALCVLYDEGGLSYIKWLIGKESVLGRV